MLVVVFVVVVCRSSLSLGMMCLFYLRLCPLLCLFDLHVLWYIDYVEMY